MKSEAGLSPVGAQCQGRAHFSDVPQHRSKMRPQNGCT